MLNFQGRSRLLIFSAILTGLLLGSQAFSQAGFVDYGDEPVVDRDLDGLTDKGETDIYKTDPQKADTDEDEFLDGTEVISGTDPLDSNSNISANDNQSDTAKTETPWAWYITRSSGMLAFTLLYLSFVVGFAIRIPWLRSLQKFINFASFHCWISWQALIFTFLHAGALLFDNYLQFRLKDILVPFMSEYKPSLVTLGVLGMYIMVVLVISSALRKKISHQSWRILHYFNMILYVFVLLHAWYLGTDFKNPLVTQIVLAANIALLMLAALNIQQKILASKANENLINHPSE